MPASIQSIIFYSAIVKFCITGEPPSLKPIIKKVVVEKPITDEMSEEEKKLLLEKERLRKELEEKEKAKKKLLAKTSLERLKYIRHYLPDAVAKFVFDIIAAHMRYRENYRTPNEFQKIDFLFYYFSETEHLYYNHADFIEPIEENPETREARIEMIRDIGQRLKLAKENWNEEFEIFWNYRKRLLDSGKYTLKKHDYMDIDPLPSSSKASLLSIESIQLWVNKFVKMSELLFGGTPDMMHEGEIESLLGFPVDNKFHYLEYLKEIEQDKNFTQSILAEMKKLEKTPNISKLEAIREEVLAEFTRLETLNRTGYIIRNKRKEASAKPSHLGTIGSDVNERKVAKTEYAPIK